MYKFTNAADAAALAGVQELPGSSDTARSIASYYAKTNGALGDRLTALVTNNNTMLTVNITRAVPLYFAKVVGLCNKELNIQVKANIQPVTASTGVVPFGVVHQNFIFGQTYQLKAGAGGGYNGKFGALALGGNGADTYHDNIKNGYDGKLYIGQWVSTKPGNMSGPTSQGVDYRVNLDPEAILQTVEKGSPRILIVPVIDTLEVNGRDDFQIVGFAAFFLEGVGGHGNENYVTGKFMQLVIPTNDLYNNEDYGAITGKVAGGYGLFGSKLLPN